jgi:hypothetical protein
VLKADADYGKPWRDQCEEIDTGEPGHCTSWAEQQELAALLGLTDGQAQCPISIPASSDYRQEYIDRAEGRAPSVTGSPYWD